jgi:hypothetical protein
LTVESLLQGKGIEYPHLRNVTFKRAPRAETAESEQLAFDDAPPPPAKGKRRK